MARGEIVQNVILIRLKNHYTASRVNVAQNCSERHVRKTLDRYLMELGNACNVFALHNANS